MFHTQHQNEQSTFQHEEKRGKSNNKPNSKHCQITVENFWNFAWIAIQGICIIAGPAQKSTLCDGSLHTIAQL